MNFEELEKLFIEIIRKCSKLDFKEQIAFLLKEAGKAEAEELRIVLYLYVNYLIEQKNMKGRTPFVLPSLGEVKQVASKLKERGVELDDLVKSPVADLRGNMGKSLYLETPSSLGKLDSSLYNISSGGASEFYKDAYIPGESDNKYREVMGSKKESFENVSGLERDLEASKRVKSVNTGYSIMDGAKKEEKKILYKH